MDGYASKPIIGELHLSGVESLESSVKPELPSSLRSNPEEVDWNLSELLERLEGDSEFLHELLEIFRRDCQSSLHKAQSAMADGNLPELSRAAHTIKGMLRNLSMNSCAEAAAGLELSAQTGDKRKSAEFLASLEAALTKILPQVEAQLGLHI